MTFKIDEKLEKEIKDRVIASDDFDLIDRVWKKYKETNAIEKETVEHQSSHLDKDKLFADSIDETIAYLQSLKKEGYQYIDEGWSGYEDNYFIAVKEELETDDEFVRRIGTDLNLEVRSEKVRQMEIRRMQEEIARKKKEIQELERQINGV